MPKLPVTNPLSPYSWRAVYFDGNVLGQYDRNGYHNVGEIEKDRLVELIITGHPSGDLSLKAREGLVRPEDIKVFSRRLISIGSGGTEYSTEFIQFGILYADMRESVAIRIYPDGKVEKLGKDTIFGWERIYE